MTPEQQDDQEKAPDGFWPVVIMVGLLMLLLVIGMAQFHWLGW